MAATLPMPTTVVWGIPVADPAAALLARRVLTVSAVMATLVISVQIWDMVSWGKEFGFSGVVAPLVSMFFGLCIPFCGWVGAKRRDRQLLCCFCGCNLCAAICYFISLASTTWLLSVIDELQEDCERGGDDALPDWASNQNWDCKDILNFDHGATRTALWLGGVSCFLQLLGFCWGRQLWSHPWVTTIQYETFPGESYQGFVPGSQTTTVLSYVQQPSVPVAQTTVPVVDAQPVAHQGGYGTAALPTVVMAKEVGPSHTYGYQAV